MLKASGLGTWRKRWGVNPPPTRETELPLCFRQGNLEKTIALSNNYLSAFGHLAP